MLDASGMFDCKKLQRVRWIDHQSTYSILEELRIQTQLMRMIKHLKCARYSWRTIIFDSTT